MAEETRKPAAVVQLMDEAAVRRTVARMAAEIGVNAIMRHGAVIEVCINVNQLHIWIV